MQTRDGENKKVDLFVVPHICEPLTTQPTSVSSFTHTFQGWIWPTASWMRHVRTRKIDMLMGSDIYWEFVTGEVVRGVDGPIAINTTLGWILSGPANFSVTQGLTVNLVTTHTLRVDDGVTNKTLDTTMRSFWELESL